MSLNISKVWLVADGTEILTDASQIVAGDQIVVHMGNVIPFKQVGGTGLGLSIVKHAAQIHKARIELHSVKGEVTTVEVRFSC